MGATRVPRARPSSRSLQVLVCSPASRWSTRRRTRQRHPGRPEHANDAHATRASSASRADEALPGPRGDRHHRWCRPSLTYQPAYHSGHGCTSCSVCHRPGPVGTTWGMTTLASSTSMRSTTHCNIFCFASKDGSCSDQHAVRPSLERYRAVRVRDARVAPARWTSTGVFDGARARVQPRPVSMSSHTGRSV